MAKEAMESIYGHGHIPILTGGTGFYIQALLYDIDFTENDEDMAYRESLENLAEEKGAEYLHEMLRRVDPESAEEIHANNIKAGDPGAGVLSSRPENRSPSTISGSGRKNPPTTLPILC